MYVPRRRPPRRPASARARETETACERPDPVRRGEIEVGEAACRQAADARSCANGRRSSAARRGRGQGPLRLLHRPRRSAARLRPDRHRRGAGAGLHRRCDDLSAVVSDSPLGVLDPTRDNVLAHQRVNETVMREHTVLPMSFGTMFKTRDDVTAFLKSAYRAFSDVLDKMENKLEFGLKVLWDRDAVIGEIEEEDEDIQPAQERDRRAEGVDLLRAHAVRPPHRRGAAGEVRALRGGDLRPAARRLGGRPREQADRRPHDPERRVSGLARHRSGPSTPGSRSSARDTAS